MTGAVARIRAKLEGRSLAEAWWDAVRLESEFEDAAIESVVEILGRSVDDPEGWGFGDITTDDYDASFELKGCTQEFPLTKEQKACFLELGFSRAWFCYGKRDEVGYREVYHTFTNDESITGFINRSNRR